MKAITTASMAACALAASAGAAAAICYEPSAPVCVSRSIAFSDTFEMNECERELDRYRREIDEYGRCVERERDEEIARLTRTANADLSDARQDVQRAISDLERRVRETRIEESMRSRSEEFGTTDRFGD